MCVGGVDHLGFKLLGALREGGGSSRKPFPDAASSKTRPPKATSSWTVVLHWLVI